uniref:Microtubule-associated protein 10 C-terminal domain-containing protein n=1 Tax=Salarias fasciatus TaxID=181472 RepID=A0A672J7L7_SALFA
YISQVSRTLFLFELLVEFIRLDRRCEVSDELALAVRLWDFPTLIIYQPRQSIKDSQQRGGDYTFNKGKSCFFKMNLQSLHSHLSAAPLYGMVLDVKKEMPILVGSSLVSLAKATDSIRQDVPSPSSHTERELVSVCSLTGERIGSISLSYKLLCMGASLLPHITERGGITSTHVREGGGAQEGEEEGNKSTDSLLVDSEAMFLSTADKSGFCTNIQKDKGENVKNLTNQNDGDDGCAAAECFHPEKRSRSLTDNTFDEEMNIFCPPLLYYTHSAEEESRKQVVDYKLLNQYPEAFTFDELCSDDEADGHEMHQEVQAEASEPTPNVLGEALRKLPVLNALLVELSQLNVNNTHHPSPACTHRPGSTEPAAGHGNMPKQAVHESKHATTPYFTHSHSPRSCSAEQSVKMSRKQEETLKESINSSKSPRKKLVYGTTKAFSLRLKHISPLKAKHRDCEKLLQDETQPVRIKGRVKSSHKTVKSSKTKIHSGLNENVETVIQSVTVDSAPREKSRQGKAQVKQDRDAQRMLEKPSLSELDLKCIHIPSMDSDNVPQSKDKKQHHSESDQSQPEPDRSRERVEYAAGSRRSSTRSSFSNSSRNGAEEVDYADDFNSLAPSDAFSPDPLSSPETSRAKTPKSPLHSDVWSSDVGSEGAQRKASILPVPVKSQSSPQHALRGTFVIRPRLHTSALSFSSDDDDGHGSASSQTADSRKQVTASGSSAETLRTPGGQSGESAESRGPVRGLSAESISSFEAQEAKELEDDVGSLDFRKEYQHISQLVANKLPGYTM